MTKIPTITLYQPWATMVMTGMKPFETRGWPPTGKLLSGRLGIHAGKSLATWKRLDPKLRETIDRRLDAYKAATSTSWPMGAMLGTVLLKGAVQCGRRAESRFGPVVEVVNAIGDISNCHRILDGWLLEDRYGDYSPGRWAWMLSAPSAYAEPIPARGKQSVWYWEGGMP